MSEGFDIFRQVDDMCNTNILESLKKSLELPQIEDGVGPIEDNLDIDGDTSGKVVKSKKKAPKVKRGSQTRKSCSSTLDELLLELGSGSIEATTSQHAVTKPARQRPTTEIPTKIASPVPSKTSRRRACRAVIQIPSPTCELPAQPEQQLPIHNGAVRRSTRLNTVTTAVPDNSENQPLFAMPAVTNKRRGRRSNTAPTADSLQLLAMELMGPNMTVLSESFNNNFQAALARCKNTAVKARRQYYAELAARSKTVDYVDLVTSPLPRIEGVINVDSDEDDFANEASKSVTSFNMSETSFDEENPEISVKVNWNGSVEVFLLRKYQKFSSIFTTLAEREKLDVNLLIFNLNDKLVYAKDTPASIDYKPYQFIYGRVLENNVYIPAVSGVTAKSLDANEILLKIQTAKRKRPLEVVIKKTDPFKILYIKCFEELNIPYQDIKLSFDGECLEYNDTPADLELDGGEMIDLHEKQ